MTVSAHTYTSASSAQTCCFLPSLQLHTIDCCCPGREDEDAAPRLMRHQSFARSDGCRARCKGWTGGRVGSDSGSDSGLPDLEDCLSEVGSGSGSGSGIGSGSGTGEDAPGEDAPGEDAPGEDAALQNGGLGSGNGNGCRPRWQSGQGLGRQPTCRLGGHRGRGSQHMRAMREAELAAHEEAPHEEAPGEGASTSVHVLE